jgi:hypothetical protein
MVEKVRLKTIEQVCIVVTDINKMMERYWTIFGVGPWSIYTLAPPELTDTTVKGEAKTYSMKLAVAKIGSMMLELIQPLEGESVYPEFLAKKGEGIHHIASYQVKDLDEAVTLLGEMGIGVLQSGRWRGATFVYMNSETVLGTVIELVKRAGPFPAPEATYP